MDPLRRALLLVVIGELPADLAAVVHDALGRGFDAPTLRVLADHPPAGADEVRALLGRVAAEIGWEMPDVGAARVELVRHWAREILTGQAAPIDGARRIAHNPVEPGAGDGEVDVFAALAAQWDHDDASGREECERRIVAEAGLLVADTA